MNKEEIIVSNVETLEEVLNVLETLKKNLLIILKNKSIKYFKLLPLLQTVHEFL